MIQLGFASVRRHRADFTRQVRDQETRLTARQPRSLQNGAAGILWRTKESIEETSTRRTGGTGGEITIGREQFVSPSHLAVVGLDLCLVSRICRLENRQLLC